MASIFTVVLWTKSLVFHTFLIDHCKINVNLSSKTDALEAFDPAKSLLQCDTWWKSKPVQCSSPDAKPCPSTARPTSELSAVTEPPITVEAFNERKSSKPRILSRRVSPHNLDLHRICGDLQGNNFKKLKSVLGLAKETLSGPFYQDLFFNRTRRHFDHQDSDQILAFVDYMDGNYDSLREYEQRRSRSTRETHRGARHRNVRHQRQSSSRKRPSSNKLKKILDKLERSHDNYSSSNLFWPWHVHILSYRYEKPTDCLGMLLGRGYSGILN